MKEVVIVVGGVSMVYGDDDAALAMKTRDALGPKYRGHLSIVYIYISSFHLLIVCFLFLSFFFFLVDLQKHIL